MPHEAVRLRLDPSRILVFLRCTLFAMAALTFKNLRGLVIDALLRPECCASLTRAVHADAVAAEEQAFGLSVKAADAPLSPLSPVNDALDVLLGRTSVAVEQRQPRSLLSVVTTPAATSSTGASSTSLLSPPASEDTPLSPTAPHNDGMALLLHAAS